MRSNPVHELFFFFQLENIFRSYINFLDFLRSLDQETLKIMSPKKIHPKDIVILFWSDFDADPYPDDFIRKYKSAMCDTRILIHYDKDYLLHDYNIKNAKKIA